MAFTIVFAGFAFTLVSLPNILLTPAFVAGFERVFKRHRPGVVNTPVFFTSCVAMATTLLITSAQAFCFRPCSVASAFATAPLVIAFAPGLHRLHGREHGVLQVSSSKNEDVGSR